MDWRHLLILPALCGLAACGSSQQRALVVDDDPVMTEAIEGQLMVDPDLSQQNMRNMAVVPDGPIDPALPRREAPPAH